MSSRVIIIIAYLIFGFQPLLAKHKLSAHHRPAPKQVFIKPQFPGGEGGLHNFINRNLRYPDAAKEADNTGRVMIRFMIDERGLVKRTTVVRSSGFSSLDAEASRCVRSMPAWIPGRYGKRAVPMFFMMPVIFQLE